MYNQADWDLQWRHIVDHGGQQVLGGHAVLDMAGDRIAAV